MRNLKKILALALALIMSLSLMVTASAAKTEFGDQESINENYQLAIEVLNELGVLKGDDRDGDGVNDFRPLDTITRGEVAAIIYRVFTGKTDANADDHGIYTAAEGEFTDVKGHWSEGYMVYAFQGGYIKGWPGVGGVVLNPGGNITGYEVLTMILRAVGYDKKENEFTGLNWKLNVSTTATEKGLLENYQGSDLGAAATRQEVAEFVFRAILLPKVEYNLVLNAYSAPDETNTIASGALKLEKIEGVVIANEWADLYDTDVITKGTTRMRLTNGTERTLNVGSDITDIGESRYAYVQNGTNVLATLEDTNKNVVKDSGVDQNIAGLAIKATSLWGDSVDKAEHYINFDRGIKDSSDYRLEYAIYFKTPDAKLWFERTYLDRPTNYSGDYLADMAEADNTNPDNERDAKIDYLNQIAGTDYYDGVNEDYNRGLGYRRVIPADTKITELDLNIMRGIFGVAASFDEENEDFTTMDADVIHAGYIYAGSKTHPDTIKESDKEDLSDGMKYSAFVDEYIGSSEDVRVSTSTNGGWLKIVDNDADGVADYVFLTTYTLAEITSLNARTGLYNYSSGLDTDPSSSAYIAPMCRDGYEPSVGDFVLYAVIDGQAIIEEAVTEQVVITTWSWRDNTVTTEDGDVYYASGTNVINGTDYDDVLEHMQHGPAYYIYLDHYGHIRAFQPVSSDRNYALLTELYLTGSQNGAYYTSETATVEMWYLNEDGELIEEPEEYTVENHDGRRVINDFVGTLLKGNPYITRAKDHNLQRAMAHLGLDDLRLSFHSSAWYTQTVGSVDGKDNTSASNTYPVVDQQIRRDTSGNSYNELEDEFVYAAVTNSNVTTYTFSQTNVAKYVLNDDGTVTINSAAEYAYDKAGNQLYYWNTDSSDNAAWVAWAADLDNETILGIGGTRHTEAEWRALYDANSTAADGDINDDLADYLIPVYAVDYVQLTTVGVSSSRDSFPVHANYGSYDALTNDHVNAVKTTQFYIVTPNDVYGYVGYDALPTIPVGDIVSMYAVARSVVNDENNLDYWDADVIVIELDKDLKYQNSRLILSYYDTYRTTNATRAPIHELWAIDCVTGEPVTVYVDTTTRSRLPGGFYLLHDAKVLDEVDADGNAVIEASAYTPLEQYPTAAEFWNDPADPPVSSYNDYYIFAGMVYQANDISTKGAYIRVWDDENEFYGTTSRRVDVDTAPWYSIHATSSTNASNGNYTYKVLDKDDYKGTSPNGHEVIWVTDRYGDVIFLIDTSFTNKGSWTPAIFLNDHNADDGDDSVYEYIITEQSEGDTLGLYTITFEVMDANATPVEIATSNVVLSQTDLVINRVNYADKGANGTYGFKVAVADPTRYQLSPSTPDAVVATNATLSKDTAGTADYYVLSNLSDDVVVTINLIDAGGYVAPPSIDDIKLQDTAKSFNYAKIDEDETDYSGTETASVTILIPTGTSDPALANESGASDATYLDWWLDITLASGTTFDSVAPKTPKDSGDEFTYEVKYKNTNNEYLTLTIHFVDDGVKYAAYMWGNNSVNMALRDVGNGVWLTGGTNGTLQELNMQPEDVTFKIAGQTFIADFTNNPNPTTEEIHAWAEVFGASPGDTFASLNAGFTKFNMGTDNKIGTKLPGAVVRIDSDGTETPDGANNATFEVVFNREDLKESIVYWVAVIGGQ